MLYPRRFITALLFLLITFTCRADFSVDLHEGWKFKESNGVALPLEAAVPGTVHTDLLTHGLIPDPFLADNEQQVQWVETRTWEYSTRFECTRAMRREKHIEIQFEGLDTYADVYLNGTLLFTSEDMFLSYTKDVKQLIKTENELRIVFHPASELIEHNRNLSKIKKYPGGDRVYIRKAQYQFGWDWGPRLVTCGIWKPVHLKGWSDFLIDNVQFTLDKLENDTAFMVCEYHMKVDKAGKYTYVLCDDQTEYIRMSRKMVKGDYGCFFTFKIPHPRLWWCNGMGEQELYGFSFSVTGKRKKSVTKITTGVRKIELSTQIPGDPNAFYFLLNDQPVFAQGANWIPSDNFLPRVKDSKVSAQLEDMRMLSMNMLRVWGGGIYESDYFYSKCDSLGLLVWQDLPYACSMYPYAELNRSGLLMMEAMDNYWRIYSHPSIAVFCGDNENREGWFNWGWQKEMGYSPADSQAIFNEYLNFGRELSIQLHPNFLFTSPKNGWGRNEAYTEGDVHYWGVWWGMEPFSSYASHTGRFVSEYGFQGMPSMHSFRQMDAAPIEWSQRYRDSSFMNHQKHPTGYQTIEEYMERDYGFIPGNIEDYAYLSQVMQDDAMRSAIEAHRRSMPRCMGTLFWQYNDCWPVTSWSVQDYYGRKKLAWYSLKRLYSPILFSVTETTDSICVWLTVRSGNTATGVVICDWNTFGGKTEWSDTADVKHTGGYTTLVFGVKKKTLFGNLSPESGYLRVYINSYGRNIDMHHNDYVHVFGKSIDRNYRVCEISAGFTRYITAGPCTVTLMCPVFQERIYLSCDDPDGGFSDNGFNLLPSEPVMVTIKTSNAALVEKTLRVISMNTVVEREQAINDN